MPSVPTARGAEGMPGTARGATGRGMAASAPSPLLEEVGKPGAARTDPAAPTTAPQPLGSRPPWTGTERVTTTAARLVNGISKNE